jgi:hypothetical protein
MLPKVIGDLLASGHPGVVSDLADNLVRAGDLSKDRRLNPSH